MNNEARSLVMKAVKDAITKQLLGMAFSHELDEGDTPQQHKLIQFANANNMTHLLPEEAHGFMHYHDIPHTHDDDGREDHTHLVAKSEIEVTHDFLIAKAWSVGDSETLFEAWASTEHQDMERDIVPPEAFKGAILDYMSRNGPLSSNHDMRHLPIGHIQQIALVRDGNIFANAYHPSDRSEFEYFPNTGTGVYVKGVVNTPNEAHAVAKGNIGGMSWYGNVRQFEYLPNRGKRYVEVFPLLETTIAAYPVNAHATLVHAKTNKG